MEFVFVYRVHLKGLFVFVLVFALNLFVRSPDLVWINYFCKFDFEDDESAKGLST